MTEPPDGPDKEALQRAVRDARARYDAVRRELFVAIRAALSGGVGPSQIARESNFTREYVAKIRDGKGPKDAV